MRFRDFEPEQDAGTPAPGLRRLMVVMGIAVLLALALLAGANSRAFQQIEITAETGREIILPGLRSQMEHAVSTVRLQQLIEAMRATKSTVRRDNLRTAAVRVLDLLTPTGDKPVNPLLIELKRTLEEYDEELDLVGKLDHDLDINERLADELLAAPPALWREAGFARLIELHRLMLLAQHETDLSRLSQLQRQALQLAEQLCDPTLFVDASFPCEARRFTLEPLTSIASTRLALLQATAQAHRLRAAIDRQVGELARTQPALDDAAAAATFDQIAGSAEAAKQTMLVAIAGLILVLALSAWVLLRLLVVPLRRIAHALDEILTGRETAPLRPHVRELRAVADGVERLEVALSALRRTTTEAITNELALRRSNRDLEAARIEALAANRAKSEFLVLMSHELRTPLNAILGFSEMISAQLFGEIQESRYLGYARDIQYSGQHLLELINDLLDLSKIEAGRWDLTPEPLLPDAVVGPSLRMVTSLARRRQIRLTTEIGKDLPTWTADLRSARQMTINLLSNACKFTPEGGSVTLRLFKGDADGVCLSVIDTGIGMDEEGIRRALEPYGQIANKVAAHEIGTGLGLPLVKAMIELHGGRMEITSAPGEGTTVSLYFPAQPPNLNDDDLS